MVQHSGLAHDRVLIGRKIGGQSRGDPRRAGCLWKTHASGRTP